MNWVMVGALSQVGQCLVLVVAVVFAWVQLGKMSGQQEKMAEQNEKMSKQHDLDRLIAWKTSVQGVNHLIFGDPETFRRVLYPGSRYRRGSEGADGSVCKPPRLGSDLLYAQRGQE